ncbi:MAG: protelomerase family protein [Prochloraceae cyanobacterium]|nr:protelomerase family protein [Prochloraceae cyanobacterium]
MLARKNSDIDSIVRRSGITSEVLDWLYETYKDSATGAVKQINQFISNKEYTIKTICKSVLPKIKKYLCGSSDYHKKAWGMEVSDLLNQQYKKVTDQINLEYDTIVNPQKQLFFESVDSSYIASWAIETLENENDKKWHRISLALAIVSGRRMLEIHGLARSYDCGNGVITPVVNGREIEKSYHFPQTLFFLGQAKTLTKNDLKFQIPVLCNAELFLERQSDLPPERLNLDPLAVNKTVSSAISSATKKLRKQLGIKSYKDSRDIYTNVTMSYFDRSYDLSEKEREILLGHILGHEIKIPTSERYSS